MSYVLVIRKLLILKSSPFLGTIVNKQLKMCWLKSRNKSNEDWKNYHTTLQLTKHPLGCLFERLQTPQKLVVLLLRTLACGSFLKRHISFIQLRVFEELNESCFSWQELSKILRSKCPFFGFTDTIIVVSRAIEWKRSLEVAIEKHKKY